jgi:hypothetical protein
MRMQRAFSCGPAQVGEEVDGADVLVAHPWVCHGHAAGEIVLVVPFHGVNDVPLL